jgi:hypothetical protein
MPGYPWPPLRRRPAPPPAPRPSPVSALLHDEFLARPFLGSSYGERIVPHAEPVPPPPAPGPGLVIEPWPWHERLEATQAAASEAEPPRPLSAALAELLAADAAEPPPPPGPPVVNPPLLPVQLPPANWRAEEVARAEAARLEAGLDEPPASLGRYPARKRP